MTVFVAYVRLSRSGAHAAVAVQASAAGVGAVVNAVTGTNERCFGEGPGQVYAVAVWITWGR